MRVNRKFFNAGLFLVAIGAIVVAADQGAIDAATLADAVRLWPLIPIAIGVALVGRRTNVGLPAGMLAAAVPGLVLGSAFAVVPRFAGTCGERIEPALTSAADGVIGQAADVYVQAGCGTFNLRTAPGYAWHLAAGNSRGNTPNVDESMSELLQIRAIDGERWGSVTGGRDRWELTLPASGIANLSLRLNSTRSYVDLSGARIPNMDVTANASDVVLDLEGSSIDDHDAFVNAGVMSIHLGASSDFSSYIRVNAGEVQLCAPPELGLQATTRGHFRQFLIGGVPADGLTWQSPNYASAIHHADVEFRIELGTVSINPIGGCR
jgi:hypothetical protein